MTVGRPVNVGVDPYISDTITRSDAREKRSAASNRWS